MVEFGDGWHTQESRWLNEEMVETEKNIRKLLGVMCFKHVQPFWTGERVTSMPSSGHKEKQTLRSGLTGVQQVHCWIQSKNQFKTVFHCCRHSKNSEFTKHMIGLWNDLCVVHEYVNIYEVTVDDGQILSVCCCGWMVFMDALLILSIWARGCIWLDLSRPKSTGWARQTYILWNSFLKNKRPS